MPKNILGPILRSAQDCPAGAGRTGTPVPDSARKAPRRLPSSPPETPARVVRRCSSSPEGTAVNSEAGCRIILNIKSVERVKKVPDCPGKGPLRRKAETSEALWTCEHYPPRVKT